MGDAVLQALADADSDARIRRLAVHAMPTSGRPEELLRWVGIDRTWIATAARDRSSSTRRPTVTAGPARAWMRGS